MSSGALRSAQGPKETTGGQVTSGTRRSHRLETGATPSGSHSDPSDEDPDRNDDGFVRLNDLVVSQRFVGLLAANGLDSLDALFRAENGQSLRKAGLGGWRERIRVTLRGAANQPGEPSLLPLSLGGRGVIGLCAAGAEPRACACGSLGEARDGADRSLDVTLYVKRYTRPPRAATRETTRAAPGAQTLAGVEWHWLRRLAEDGIPAPQPVALGEEITGGREARSVLLMTAVPGDALERVLANPDALDARAIRRLVRPMAEMVGKFHRLGYVHRDLYLSHVFLDAAEDDGARLSLIDVQRVMRPATHSAYRIVKDLASLNYSAPVGRVTRTDRLRWLRCYLETNALPTSSKCENPLVGKPPVAPGGLGTRRLSGAGRRLVYRIVGKSLQIRRHQARREARLAEGSGSR